MPTPRYASEMVATLVLRPLQVRRKFVLYETRRILYRRALRQKTKKKKKFERAVVDDLADAFPYILYNMT